MLEWILLWSACPVDGFVGCSSQNIFGYLKLHCQIPPALLINQDQRHLHITVCPGTNVYAKKGLELSAQHLLHLKKRFRDTGLGGMSGVCCTGAQWHNKQV